MASLLDDGGMVCLKGIRRYKSRPSAGSKPQTGIQFAGWLARNVRRYKPYAHSELIRETLDTSRKAGRYIFLAVPPQHGKTLVCTAYAVYLLTLLRCRVVIASYNQDYANVISGQARQLAEESGMKLVSKAVNHWTVEGGGSFKAVGVGGSKVGFSADVVIFDDLFSGYTDYLSKASRDSVWKNVGDFLDRVNRDRMPPWVAFVNTRYGPDDVWARIEKDEILKPDFDFLSLPAISAGEGDPLGRPKGVLLCPELCDDKKLRIAERVRGSAFRPIYLCQATQGEGGMFPRAKWGDPIKVPPSKLVGVVRGWDRAASSKRGDYSAGVLLGRDMEGNTIILDVQRGQWSVSERNAIIRQTAVLDEAKYGKVTIVIEQEPGSSGVESAELAVKMLAGHNVKIERPTSDKETRAQPFADQQQVSNCRILSAPWNKAFIDEMDSFPGGDNDDQTDACCMAWLYSLKSDKLRLADYLTL